MQFSTNKFANGIRKLTLKDQKGHSATKFVRFKNIVSNTDCDIVFTTGGANGTLIPKKCRISANCDSPSCIIEILDNCNPHLVVRTYSVKSHSFRIFWDGLDNHTKEAPPGIYFIVFKAGMPPYPQVVTNKLDSKNLTPPSNASKRNER